MKNFLSILFVLIFSNTTVNAAYQVNYNSAGAVTSVNHMTPFGVTTNTNINNFGSNAIYTPINSTKAGIKNRQTKYDEAYYENLKNSQTINVNVNHNPPLYNNMYYNNRYRYNYGNNYYSPVQRTFYRNGVQYFNGINSRGIIY